MPHAAWLLFAEVALLLLVARACAEGAKRVGLPAVVGELISGILLGPSVLGHFAPASFAALFPRAAEQRSLLEVVGNLGMVLLLLVTGLETDLRALKTLGRPALLASILGMLVPFGSGYALGLVMPDEYLAHPERRVLFSAFLATAMAISAMPVIAKILLDLDLTQRDIGVVILSAVIVDDTAGWLVLSVIVGAATRGAVRLAELGTTLLGLAGFLVAVRLFFPALKWLVVRARSLRTKDSELVLVVIVALGFGAVTERAGVHAVFGAFVAGVALAQASLSRETVQRLESFVFAILAPIFFGVVGLKVDLWALRTPTMLFVVLGLACAGKLVGAAGGALWGGLRFWDSLSVAIAMNARGAMELVVASIGLSLGILNEQMFSIIVVVAVATSLFAPIGLRFTVPRASAARDVTPGVTRSTHA